MGSERTDGRGGTQTLTSTEAPKKRKPGTTHARSLPSRCEALLQETPHVSFRISPAQTTAHQPGAKPHPATNPYLPKRQKTSPISPPLSKSETNFRFVNGGCSWGKFGEDEGGLEGEGTPSDRGFLLPPRYFPHPSLRRVIRGCDKAGVSLLHFRASRRILFGVAEPETDCNRRVHLVHHALVEMSHLFA